MQGHLEELVYFLFSVSGMSGQAEVRLILLGSPKSNALLIHFAVEA